MLEQALTVFVYHDISEVPSEFSYKYQLNVCPNLFEWQLRFLKKHFNFVSPDDLLEDRVPPKAALLTFDDGFSSFFTNAATILEKHQVPCIIFLNMAPIKGEIFWSGLITYLCEKKPDFVAYLKKCMLHESREPPLFLSCSAEIVCSYIKKAGEDVLSQVLEFVGSFADEESLEQGSANKLICYGNHLYNHYVPLLMSDMELLDSFDRNANALKKYPNFRNMFSFPFGQPDSCFSHRQVDLLFERGAKKIFRSSGTVNYKAKALYLDRIALTSWHTSSERIWYQIFKHRLKKINYEFGKIEV
jgi:hypothetical protein